MKIAVISFSKIPKEFINGLQNLISIDQVYVRDSSRNINDIDQSICKIDVKKFIQRNWKGTDLFIFIGSISASVRLISPLLISKDKDPGVIVLDKKGKKIIPLLGIHQTDSYKISRKLTNLFGGDLIITNNSIFEKTLDLDSFGQNWGWIRSGSKNNWSNLVINQSNKQEIFAKQISGNQLWMKSKISKKINKLSSNNKVEYEDNTFFISTNNSHNAAWHPPTLWIGIGCERNTSVKFIEECINKLFAEYKLSCLSIAGIATIDLKKDEKALVEISRAKNWPIKFFSSDELLKVDVPNPSKIVFDEIGSFSVSEASSILACDDGGQLLIEKNIFKHKDSYGKNIGAVTLAIAESRKQFAPQKGIVHVIGSGPGDLSFLTFESKAALSDCSVWIGYKMYLDLLEPLMRDDQIRINSELKHEKQRCADAISLAQEGIKVALISSGDSGIYGMAGLLIELMQKIESSLRPSFLIHPGISSLQLAASLAGAPLMNDFCAVSLSNKLTPWETIEKRINGALMGDFVVAIFNPQSSERNWQLKKTIDMFLKFRSKSTPVLVARQVGRNQQQKRFFNLNEIPFAEIDMLSIIIIGNSSTRLIDGNLISPRGYL